MRRTARNISRLVELPFEERPRERFLGQGSLGLRDAELVALVLRTGAQGRDAVALAEALLSRHGGLASLLNQDGATLRQTKGLGAAKAASLLAVRELAARAELMKLKRGRYLANTQAVLRYLRWRLQGLQREVFGLLLLNARHYVLGIEYLFYGSVDRSAIYTREIVKACLKRNAASVVMFHNHPSGDADPSQSDKDITNRVSSVLERDRRPRDRSRHHQRRGVGVHGRAGLGAHAGLRVGVPMLTSLVGETVWRWGRGFGIKRA